MYVCVYVCMCVCMCVCVYVCMCLCGGEGVVWVGRGWRGRWGGYCSTKRNSCNKLIVHRSLKFPSASCHNVS